MVARLKNDAITWEQVCQMVLDCPAVSEDDDAPEVKSRLLERWNKMNKKKKRKLLRKLQGLSPEKRRGYIATALIRESSSLHRTGSELKKNSCSYDPVANWADKAAVKPGFNDPEKELRAKQLMLILYEFYKALTKKEKRTFEAFYNHKVKDNDSGAAQRRYRLRDKLRVYLASYGYTIFMVLFLLLALMAMRFGGGPAGEHGVEICDFKAIQVIDSSLCVDSASMSNINRPVRSDVRYASGVMDEGPTLKNAKLESVDGVMNSQAPDSGVRYASGGMDKEPMLKNAKLESTNGAINSQDSHSGIRYASGGMDKSPWLKTA